ncbi:thiamine phosphate synthase [Bosea caraganae]|uniref:Thiamine phosphate synthase n=1 Tax=Bosea caraganae TaxID=2763117 RepID=A0A370L825_9HYPH|nr:thiamine phosphate synthase [Bosea caraganae]RDJ25488.1 thiamine phosphate synthase [Bosea caraganae]RDJ25726.1 thiamine phosphate synthase [Bosea caraganae]
MRALPDRLLVVTDRHQARRPLEEVVAAALEGGARWVWLRDRDLEAGERRELAQRLLRLTEAAGAVLTIGGDAGLAAEVGASGVHLSSAMLETGKIASPVMVGLVPTIHAFARDGLGVSLIESPRPPPALQDVDARHKAEHDGEGVRALLGMSAHGEADIRAAIAAGADYVTLSPVFETASKPGYGPALGLAAIERAAKLGVPIIALGGVTPERAAQCLEAGAAGIAVMGEVMRADDPAAVVRRYMEALRSSSSRGEPSPGWERAG